MIYKGDYLNEISFPIGGIGTGSIGLAGNGQLIDWEIFNRPNKGGSNGYSHMAVKLYKDGKTITKILNSDMTKEFMGKYEQKKYGGFGYGPSSQSMCAYPHFKNCVFSGEFPIAELTFTDDEFPGAVVLRAFNPFIPLDSKNSSIPAACYEIIYKNEGDSEVTFQGIFSLANPYKVSRNVETADGNITSVKLMRTDKAEDERDYCDLSLSCENPTFVQPYWYRGGWQDSVSTYWNELAYSDTLTKRIYETDGKEGSKCNDTCSILKSVTLKPGESANIRFVVSWNVPNNYVYWGTRSNLEESQGVVKNRNWKNYYATIFEDSVASGRYALENWDDFYLKTKLFKDELFSSTVDEVIKDAVSSTISVLKTPTVYRLENGEFYGFEGNHEKEGSCEGTCQHVYNYAYALCFLFPDLERSIRDLEFFHATNEDGQSGFRLVLPLCEETKGTYGLACVDGQMGCVIKTYREWKISGDNEWLKKVWPMVKKVLEFAWSDKNDHKWDEDKDGVLEGRQHHTLDMELFGPSSWLEGFYLAALKAAAEMAEFLGEEDKAKEYTAIYEKGRAWTDENLFNGKYFIQKVDINNKSILEKFDQVENYWNEETGEIKYQVAEGSSIDQLTGQWHANLCGLGDIFDKDKTKTALEHMYKYNFKKSMRDVVNMWRVFAVNDEGGSIMCDYPEGAYKPRIPITYCEECMTGFEYQFAGMLMYEGYKKEAIEVVAAIRDRYDGKKRNPWNEIECGSNYVRAMASFALLPIISGFSFDLPNFKMGFNPICDTKDFKCIWSLGTGWGNVKTCENKARINLKSGSVTLSALYLPFIKNAEKLIIDGREVDFEVKDGVFTFEKTTIKDFAEII